MARFRVIAVLILLYGGVAQALALCSPQNGHRAYSSVVSHEHHAAGDEHPHSAAKWHCQGCELQVGVALPRARTGLWLETDSPRRPVAALEVRALAQGSVARPYKLPSISTPASSARFMPFISVFQL